MGGKGGERNHSSSVKPAAEVKPNILGTQPLFLSRKDRIKTIRKPHRLEVPFDKGKISDAIFKAAQAVGGEDRSLAENLAETVTIFLNERHPGSLPAVEDIQEEYERMKKLGVNFTMEPTEMGHVTIAVFDDTCGNLIQIAQE